MLEQLIPILAQSGAVGIIAYLLLQTNREQEKAHQEAYKTLILQMQAGNDTLRQQITATAVAVLERNSDSLSNAAQRLASLESYIRRNVVECELPHIEAPAAARK